MWGGGPVRGCNGKSPKSPTAHIRKGKSEGLPNSQTRALPQGLLHVHQAGRFRGEMINIRWRLCFLVYSHFLSPQLIFFHLHLSGPLVFVPRGLLTPLFCRQQTFPEPFPPPRPVNTARTQHLVPREPLPRGCHTNSKSLQGSDN